MCNIEVSGNIEHCENHLKTELQEIEACLNRPSPSMMTMLFEDPANWAKKNAAHVAVSPRNNNTKGASAYASSYREENLGNESYDEYSRYYEHETSRSGAIVEYDYENGSSSSSFDVNSFIASSSGSSDIGGFATGVTTSSSKEPKNLSPLLMYQMSSLMRPDASEDLSSDRGLTPIEEEDAK